MESEIQTNIKPLQTPAPVTILPSTNWIKLSLYGLFFLLILASTLFIGIQIGKNQKSPKALSVVEPTSTITQPTLEQTASPTSTITQPTLEQTISPTPSVLSLNSDQFGFNLKYPHGWTYFKNGDNYILKLPYIKNVSDQNETLLRGDGCAIHFGFGGGSGPSNDMQSESIKISSLNYTKKTWLIEGKPVFSSYILEGNTPVNKKFELLLSWISKTNSDLCQKEIDQILSTLEFTN